MGIASFCSFTLHAGAYPAMCHWVGEGFITHMLPVIALDENYGFPLQVMELS